MLLMIIAKDSALLFDGNIGLFPLACFRRALDRLFHVLVADRAKFYRAAEHTRQLIARFLSALLRSRLEHDAFFFNEDGADAALKIARRFEPNVAAVVLIDDIVAIREQTTRPFPVEKIEDHLGKDKRLAVAGGELGTGRQRDLFQPQLMKDGSHRSEEIDHAI